jgi:hypothetical protein
LSGGWSDVSNALIGDVAALIPTAGVQVMVDVGGDNSTLLDLLMEKSPGMQGIVLDRPKPLAPEMPPADLYLLTCALRDWDDETCAVVLRRCREAMRPGGRVAVVELIVGEITDPGPAALLDLNRLATVVGRERSLTEYDALLRAAGLLRTSVASANRSPYGVIEATAC